MKKQILAIVLMMVSTGIFAQEFKLPKTSGKLLISEVNNVTIEGYDGKEIVFSSMDGRRKRINGQKDFAQLALWGWKIIQVLV